MVSLTCEELLTKSGCRILVTGPKKKCVRAVAANAKVYKGFGQLQILDQGSLLRTMEQWCAGNSIPDGKHKKNEGRYESGGQSVLRQAFASQCVRLYGYVERIGELEVFTLVDLDIGKKQRKADPVLLEAVGKKALEHRTLIRKLEE
jgi:hypothetical protein